MFEANWPWLEQRLATIQALEPEGRVPGLRPSGDKLDEILDLVRSLARSTHVEPAAAPSPTPVPPQATAVRRRPKVFIGSSTEGLEIAEAIQLGLDAVAECTVWNQSAFELTIEGIVDISRGFDFAVLVLTPDNMLVKRGETGFAPRDNLVFELGLFTGALGRARTFLVYSRDDELQLPSDLSGVTAATYATRSDGNLQAALGPVCSRIKRAMGVLGRAGAEQAAV